MGQDPSEIRQEIEEAREHMGETVEALGYKTDVKTRAKESIVDKRDRLKDQISGVTGQVTGAAHRANEATPGTQDVKQGARRAAGVAQENPIGLAMGGVAVGFLVGMLMPTTRVEDEKIGPMADQVKEKARETGQEAMEHGKQVAQEVADQTKETVSKSGSEHAQQVASSAQEKAQEVRS